MKRNVFMPIATSYDPDEKEALQKCFGVTDAELLALMTKIGRAAKSSDDGVYSQDILMGMVETGEISDSLILYLACHGSNHLWEGFADGIFLMLDAQDEAEKGADE